MSTDPVSLTVSEIREINREISKLDVPYTGGEVYSIKEEKLESLVENAPNKNPIDTTGYYLKNISLLQAFPDANHRTALIAAQLYLERKGYRLDYTVGEAKQMRDQMLSLQLEIYGTYEELPEEVTEEPDDELSRLCRDFISRHAISE